MPFDPDAYLKSIDQPKPGFDPDAYLKSKEAPASDYTQDIVNVGKGFAKGVGRYAVGAGQIAEDVFPSAAAAARAIPGVSSAAHAAKEFVTSPNQTWSESAGNLAGTAAPAVVGAFTGVDEAAAGPYIAARLAPYAGRFTGPLSEIAARAGFGAAAGGLEATKEGDLKSHLRGAEVGGVTAGLTSPRVLRPVGRIGGTLGIAGAVEEVARRTGIHPYLIALAMGVGGFGGHHAMWNTGLAQTAGRWAATLGNYLPAGFVGGEAGKAVGGSSDGR